MLVGKKKEKREKGGNLIFFQAHGPPKYLSKDKDVKLLLKT